MSKERLSRVKSDAGGPKRFVMVKLSLLVSYVFCR